MPNSGARVKLVLGDLRIIFGKRNAVLAEIYLMSCAPCYDKRQANGTITIFFWRLPSNCFCSEQMQIRLPGVLFDGWFHFELPRGNDGRPHKRDANQHDFSD